MLRPALILSATLALAACNSSLNPFNLFDGGREQVVVTADTPANPVIAGRVLVSQLTQLSVEQTTSGAIVRATGIVPVQGFYDAELVLVEETPSGIVYEFRVENPPTTAIAGPQEISVGAELSISELASIRTITVVSASNRRSVSRR